MVYGQAPQLDPHHPSHTFVYVVSGDTRRMAITVAAPIEADAKHQACEHLDRWHGSGRWEWHLDARTMTSADVEADPAYQAHGTHREPRADCPYCP